jgi:cytidylate kinase
VTRPRPLVTIDGPAGAGKSTVSRMLASELGFTYLDTGALYRAVALRARQSPDLREWLDDGGALDRVPPELGGLAGALDLRFGDGGTRLWVDDAEVTAEIRAPEVSQGASRVSAVPEVREALLEAQRRIGRAGGVVAEGRDVGTVVFPDAEVKFFLTADVACRAQRRVDELRARGLPADLAQTRREIEERDRRDANRAVAPLRRPEGAIEIDSGPIGPSEVLSEMIRVVRAREGS